MSSNHPTCRKAAAGDFRPPDHYKTEARHHAHSSWPSPGPPGTTNKVTGIVSDDSVDADTNNDGAFDAGSGPGAEDQGGGYQIVGNHVYTVESIDDEYVTLINPWGRNNLDAGNNHVGSGGRIRITREEYATYFPSTDVGRTS